MPVATEPAHPAYQEEQGHPDRNRDGQAGDPVPVAQNADQDGRRHDDDRACRDLGIEPVDAVVRARIPGAHREVLRRRRDERIVIEDRGGDGLAHVELKEDAQQEHGDHARPARARGHAGPIPGRALSHGWRHGVSGCRRRGAPERRGADPRPAPRRLRAREGSGRCARRPAGEAAGQRRIAGWPRRPSRHRPGAAKIAENPSRSIARYSGWSPIDRSSAGAGGLQDGGQRPHVDLAHERHADVGDRHQRGAVRERQVTVEQRES